MVKQAAKDALGKTIEFKAESLKKVLDPMEGIRSKQIFGRHGARNSERVHREKKSHGG
jgi:hypothetical protein